MASKTPFLLFGTRVVLLLASGDCAAMQKPTASPPTMQYIAKKRKECKARGVEAATSLLPGAPSERGNPRFVLWDTPGAKVAALGEVSIDDGAPHGAVASLGAEHLPLC